MRKIKAEVLDYYIMYHSIYCGVVKLKLLEGINKDGIIDIQITTYSKIGDIIEIYEGD